MVAGQYNLIEIDGNEQSIPVFNVIFFDYYVSGNKTHDIAVVEVRHKIYRLIYRLPHVIK